MSFIISIIHFMHDTFPKVTAHLDITYTNLFLSVILYGFIIFPVFIKKGEGFSLPFQ